MTARTILLSILALGVISDGFCRSESSEPSLTVRLKKGDRLTGTLDVRTNEHRLYLRIGTERAHLIQPVPWDRIVDADVQERTLSRPELQEFALAEAARQRNQRDAQRHVDERGQLVLRASGPDVSIEPPPAPAPPAVPPVRPAGSLVESRVSLPLGRVRSVAIEAFVENWDRDVELDGLVVLVFPHDGAGNLVPAKGTVNLEMFGTPRGRRSFHASPLGAADKVERFGRWSRELLPGDLSDRGYVVRLPFQAVHPQFDRRSGRYGLVHARLAVPGDGVFHDSRDAVLFRPFAPTRDALERDQLRRFLPTEPTSVGRRRGVLGLYSPGPR